MPVEKLQINKNFFNKLNSVYSNKKSTNPQSFGSSPVSVITEKPKPPAIAPFIIQDNTGPSIERKIPEKISELVKQIKKTKLPSPKKQKEVFQIIEKTEKTEKKIKTNNSFHLYDDDNHTHLVAKLDKRNPLYNKLINLPFDEIINISYKNDSQKHYIIGCILGLVIGIMVGFFTSFNPC